MGFLSTLRTYAQSWIETDRAKFSKEDLAMVQSAEVVTSDFGLSACLFIKGGGKKYIPLSRDSDLEKGDTIQLENAKIITLSREGESDIYRLQA